MGQDSGGRTAGPRASDYGVVAEVLAAVVTVATLPVLLSTYGTLGAAVASLLGYSTIACR